jgi:flavodoxin
MAFSRERTQSILIKRRHNVKTLVAYYSHSGNNRFIAEKLAKDLGGDLAELRPRVKAFGFVLIASLTRLSFGNRKPRLSVADYDTVILCGPIYMGQLIAPLRDFMTANRKKLKCFYFATCCGGGEEEKDSKFGYNAVFAKARAILGDKLAGCAAFSFELFAADELKANPEGVMNIKLTEDRFTGGIAERYADFLREVQK